MIQHLGLRDPRDLQTLSQPNFSKLRTFLKGVLIMIVIPGQSRDRSTRPKRIADLIPQAGLQEFDKDGERLTVQVRDSAIHPDPALGTDRTPHPSDTSK